MNLINQPLDFEIEYPDSDGLPMAESDQTREFLIYCVEALDEYFRDRSDVYVSGNSFIYYRQGVPDAVISPDVFVVFGVEKKKRRSYKVWEEGGITPRFVMEITSKTTQEKDEQEKPDKYAQLEVQEYFQYDPTGDYLNPPLKGSVLVKGQYQAIAPAADGTFYSQILGLELRLLDGDLRFFVPQTGEKLLSFQEMDQARRDAEQAQRDAEQARRDAEQARLDAIPRLIEMGLSIAQVAIALGLPLEQVRDYRP
jgi:Uma2 family endonuclease